jgi:hypothetical protein
MSRLPSVPELERDPANAAAIVSAWHRDTKEEIDGLKSGHIYPSDGRSRGYHLKLSRARMARVLKLADRFNVYLPES